MFSKMKKYVVSAAAAGLIFLLPAAAGVKVSEGKIQLGTSFQLTSGSPAEFECRIVNPDPKPHRVMIRLMPAGNYPVMSNSNSPETIIPPCTDALFRFPVFPGTEDTFSFRVFEDGVRQPNSTFNTCSLRVPDNRTGMVGILNDFGNTPGGFKQNRYLRKPLIPVIFRAGKLPRHSGLYRSLTALIVVEPDFSRYTAEQFAAILEYVSGGGILIFADPQGTLAAASTPLAELLPVVPLGIRMSENAVSSLSPSRSSNREIKVLDAIDKRKSSATEFPLLTESRYGLGTVRWLAFAPVPENFPDNTAIADKFIAELLNAPENQQSFAAFRKPLDKLTGFAVPETASVRNILLIYFALLFIILILGFRWKRQMAAWLTCGLTAIVLTAAILSYVHRKLGKRSALAARLQVVNAQIPDSGRCYISLYAPAEIRTTVRTGKSGSLFEQLPFRNSFNSIRDRLENLKMAPLDLRMQPDDFMEIREMNLAARSSRQIMEDQSVSVPPGNAPDWTAPQLHLTAEGIRLVPWKIPAAADAEAVFVLFPNGSKPAEITPGGICIMKNHDSALADPLMEDLRTAMEKSHSRRHSAVVVVSRETDDFPGLEKKFFRQGRRLTVYPADLSAESKNFLFPNELLVLVPAETASRMVLDGGKINPEYSMQQGMSITLHISRPGARMLPAEFSSLKIKAKIAGSDKIEPVLKLYTGGKPRGEQLIPGRKTGPGEYLFNGPEVKKLFVSEDPVKLVIEGTAKKTRRAENDFTVAHWSLLDLQMELRGGTRIQNKEISK